MKTPHSGRPYGPGRPSDAGRPASGDKPAFGTRPASGARPASGGKSAQGGKPAFGTRPDFVGKAATGRPAYGRNADKPSHKPRTEAPAATPPATARPVAERLSLQRRPDAPAVAQRSRAELEAPRGSVWLYGLHAVAAALANPNRRLRRLLLTEEAEAALAARQRQPWPLVPERAERGRLDNLLGRDAVHQGIGLLADPLPVPALAGALARPGPVLVLDQVSDPRNVGAILRSAAAFGAACVIAQERNAPEETGALAKAASGALETMPLLRAVNISRTLIALKAAGFWTVGLDAGGAALSGAALAERRVALVLGAEGEGLRRLVRETCDEVAGIAMPGASTGGGLDSLNVSNAAAIALYELARRP